MSVQTLPLQEALALVESEKQVVIDFYSESCAPCKHLSTTLDTIAPILTDTLFIKVCVDDAETSKYAQTVVKMRGVPTVLYYKDGKETKRTSGTMPPSKLEEVVKAAMV